LPAGDENSDLFPIMKLCFKPLRLVLLLALSVPLGASGATVTIKGSDTMVILFQRWAEVYAKNHPDASLQVNGGGSGTGIAALLNGTTQIANESRALRAEEMAAFIKKFKVRPHVYKICFDAVSIYVNARNPVTQLNLKQLEGIFTGKTTNWKALGGPDAPIALYGRDSSSGTYDIIKEKVLAKHDFAAAVKTLSGTAIVAEAVKNDPNGIGYGGVAYGRAVKLLSISKGEGYEAVAPTEENAVEGRYPLTRVLLSYVNPSADKGAVASFINWCISDAGQEVVKDVGYYPLPKNLR
jgi:phosphate transport system substrate-binding protein